MSKRSSSNNSRSTTTLKRPRSPPPVAVNTRFKGVVPQISGHWGAQIYANHQRIWLGTFKSEIEAAMAYDTAAIKLRSSDSHRNFPWSISMQEPLFQKHYSTESVLTMIKDGSYAMKFSEFLKQNQGKKDEDDNEGSDNAAVGSPFFMENNNLMMKMEVNGMDRFTCRQLFHKELTPSDVGKLNRLVIPKKFAVNFFPEIIAAQNNNNNNNASEEGQGNGNNNDVLLSFYDAFARLWKFRYCYWKSSQSFVLTRGWNRFVKEKELKDKDVITFFVCEADPKTTKNNTNENDRMKVSPFYLIDVSYSHARSTNDIDKFTKEDVIGDERKDTDSKGTPESEVAEEKEAEEFAAEEELQERSGGMKVTSIRLFGVDIQK